MELNPETRLKEVGLREIVQNIHEAITEKFPAAGIPFDTWYTKREEFWKNMDWLSRSTAQKLRQMFGISWQKDLPEPLFKVLDAKGTAPKNWEDGPDGALTALAIIVSAWVANQAAQKSRGNPNNFARQFFEECLRPLIIAAMEDGIKMAEEQTG